MLFGAATDIGKRRRINEDSMIIGRNSDYPYIAVADGMGGHNAGDMASSMAVEAIEGHIESNMTGKLDYVEASEVVRHAFIMANSKIYTYSKNHYKIMGMGTTATLAMVYGDMLITAHVGDSRAYIVKEDRITQITRDHSYVQELLQRGEITPEQAKNHPQRNYITRAVGVEDSLKVDIGIRPYSGEKILVCSDGLTNMVSENEIFEILNAEPDLDKAAKLLIDKANEFGGADNITAVLMEKE